MKPDPRPHPEAVAALPPPLTTAQRILATGLALLAALILARGRRRPSPSLLFRARIIL
jgi:hypothetical protein